MALALLNIYSFAVPTITVSVMRRNRPVTVDRDRDRWRCLEPHRSRTLTLHEKRKELIPCGHFSFELASNATGLCDVTKKVRFLSTIVFIQHCALIDFNLAAIFFLFANIIKFVLPAPVEFR